MYQYLFRTFKKSTAPFKVHNMGLRYIKTTTQKSGTLLYSTPFTHTTPHSMQFVATHCKENPISVFLFWELRGLSPNFQIHAFVSDLYIPRIGPHISFSKVDRPILEIYKSLTDTCECRSRETEHHNSVLGNKEAVPFHLWEYINGNQTFILDSHRPSFAVRTP